MEGARKGTGRWRCPRPGPGVGLRPGPEARSGVRGAGVASPTGGPRGEGAWFEPTWFEPTAVFHRYSGQDPLRSALFFEAV